MDYDDGDDDDDDFRGGFDEEAFQHCRHYLVFIVAVIRVIVASEDMPKQRESQREPTDSCEQRYYQVAAIRVQGHAGIFNDWHSLTTPAHWKTNGHPRLCGVASFAAAR